MSIPATQLLSWKQIQPKISPRKAKILSALERLGEATDREVMNHLGYTDMDSVRPRITEMLKDTPCLIRERRTPKWDKLTERYVRVVTLIHECSNGQIKMWG